MCITTKILTLLFLCVDHDEVEDVESASLSLNPRPTKPKSRLSTIRIQSDVGQIHDVLASS
jgi:hypothetical protein